jgi:hypothetical protein
MKRAQQMMDDEDDTVEAEESEDDPMDHYPGPRRINGAS